mmetsp:Transcript_34528/g.108436  ORF Transcript_34528/g.108436 Transcript_34528/m.108436 type:complete len:509 (+) Transcript_34528:22-1548(+)
MDCQRCRQPLLEASPGPGGRGLAPLGESYVVLPQSRRASALHASLNESLSQPVGGGVLQASSIHDQLQTVDRLFGLAERCASLPCGVPLCEDCASGVVRDLNARLRDARLERDRLQAAFAELEAGDGGPSHGALSDAEFAAEEAARELEVSELRAALASARRERSALADEAVRLRAQRAEQEAEEEAWHAVINSNTLRAQAEQEEATRERQLVQFCRRELARTRSRALLPRPLPPALPPCSHASRWCALRRRICPAPPPPDPRLRRSGRQTASAWRSVCLAQPPLYGPTPLCERVGAARARRRRERRLPHQLHRQLRHPQLAPPRPLAGRLCRLGRDQRGARAGRAAPRRRRARVERALQLARAAADGVVLQGVQARRAARAVRAPRLRLAAPRPHLRLLALRQGAHHAPRLRLGPPRLRRRAPPRRRRPRAAAPDRGGRGGRLLHPTAGERRRGAVDACPPLLTRGPVVAAHLAPRGGHSSRHRHRAARRVARRLECARESDMPLAG